MRPVRGVLNAIAVGLAALTLLGCGPFGFVLDRTITLFTPPPRTTPKYTFGDKSIVILVDVANQDLAERYPQMTYGVARTVAAELSKTAAAGRIVNPRDVAMAAQHEPGFRTLSTVAVGERFGVDQVLHMIVTGYGLESAVGGGSYNGAAGVSLRVIDVAEREQVWPPMNQLHQVDVRSSAGITAATRAEAEETLLEGLALEVSMVFAEYFVEDIPRGREVR